MSAKDELSNSTLLIRKDTNDKHALMEESSSCLMENIATSMDLSIANTNGFVLQRKIALRKTRLQRHGQVVNSL